MASQPLRAAGFEGEALNTWLGIEWVECLDPLPSTCTCHPELGPRVGLHYNDAVGDLAQLADPVVAAKWGPSIGSGQVRSLRDPNAWGTADRWRVADKLRDPWYNAHACWAISVGGTRKELWTPGRTGTYLPHSGEDFELHAGHIRAHLWNS
jgi:hypothetical protein